MDFDEVSLFESDSSIIQRMMKQSGLNFSFQELQLRGYEYISNDVFIPNSENTFDTPSQKIEIASKQAQTMGLPRVPQPWFEAPAEKGKFRLLSPASYWRMNDSYSNDKNIQKRSGEAKLLIHPDDAIKLNITEDTIVEISNTIGAVRLTACIDDTVPLKTLVSYKGRWPSIEPSERKREFCTCC